MKQSVVHTAQLATIQTAQLIHALEILSTSSALLLTNPTLSGSLLMMSPCDRDITLEHVKMMTQFQYTTEVCG